MKVGIVGLGLIGGSMAKAYKKAGHTVAAYDRDNAITEFAMLDGAADEKLDSTNIGECKLILLAVCPQAAVEYLKENAAYISKDAAVIDLCGTKRMVCRECFKIAAENGFIFIGGHPMAGTHNSGYKFSDAELFKGAPMVIVPERLDDIGLLEFAKNLLEPAGFAYITGATAEDHDKIIAFTSQLAHVVSNAYIKSPSAKRHKGFSAGSYKDLTRVAWLNPEMWAELFLENGDNLVFELDTLIANLMKYRDAIVNNERRDLVALLDDGRRKKEKLDGLN